MFDKLKKKIKKMKLKKLHAKHKKEWLKAGNKIERE